MSDRVSQTIILCEDDPQAQLVRAYMKRCGMRAPNTRELVASREVYGGNVTWVLRRFPEELHACRQRHRTHANTLLIVVVDADDFDRLRQLSKEVKRASLAPLSDADPAVLLIPRRHIETWIRAALGEQVNETDSYKKPAPKNEQIRSAAKQIHGWARDNPEPDSTCIASLKTSLPGWRRIG